MRRLHTNAQRLVPVGPTQTPEVGAPPSGAVGPQAPSALSGVQSRSWVQDPPVEGSVSQKMSARPSVPTELGAPTARMRRSALLSESRTARGLPAMAVP